MYINTTVTTTTTPYLDYDDNYNDYALFWVLAFVCIVIGSFFCSKKEIVIEEYGLRNIDELDEGIDNEYEDDISNQELEI